VNENFVSQHFKLQPGEIDSVLSRCHLQTKLVSGGSEISVRDCPLCEKKGQPVAGKSTNQWKLHFRADSGAFNCVRCKSHGSWYEFKKEMGMLPQIDHVAGNRAYKRPNQDIANSYPAALSAFPEIADYLINKRKIKKTTLEKYLVGATIYSFQEDNNPEWIETPCITFPWMDYFGGQWLISRIKARAVHRKEWMRLDPSGGEWGLFGWHTIPQQAEEIVLTEGEFDAMSVWQETGVPAISCSTSGL
jgi:twinkle protein